MKYFTTSLITVLIVFICSPSFGQTKNSKFEWHFKKECYPKNSGIEIFRKIETPPMVHGVTQEQLISEMKKIIKKSTDHSDKDIEFRVQVFTLVDYEACIGKIGMRNGSNESLAKQIIEYFEGLNNIELGRRRGKEINCLSEIYIYTTKNKLKDIKFSNLQFEQ